MRYRIKTSREVKIERHLKELFFGRAREDKDNGAKPANTKDNTG